MELSGVRLPANFNGIGMHDSPGSNIKMLSYEEAKVHAAELKAVGVTAYKLLVEGANKVQRARGYVDSGILTSVRFYKEPYWGTPPQAWVVPGDQIKPYVDVGVQLCEFGNEFNIACEWPGENIPKDPAVIARVVVDAWEVMLARAHETGCVPWFPSNTPGGHVDHRLCYPAIRAELIKRGLLDTLKHVAVHPRPHNNPPDTKWTKTNTVTFDEWRWIRDTLQPSAYYWATEHGYSYGDSQNHEYPRIDLPRHTDYNWELTKRMDPAHPQATEPQFAGFMHWFEAGWGHWGGWCRDALRDGCGPDMPQPSPLWVRMGERVNELRFQRYGDQPPPPPPPGEYLKGIDVSYVQSAGIKWDLFLAEGNKFVYVRLSKGVSLDSSGYGHVDQARYRKIDTGVYHYLTTEQDGKRQARLFASLSDNLDLQLPCAVDVEDSRLDAETVQEFVEEWRKQTRRPLAIYTSASKWWEIVGPGATWAAVCPLWIADARDRPEPEMPAIWTEWDTWQTGVKLGPEYKTALCRDVRHAGEIPPPPPLPAGDIEILDREGHVKDWFWLTATFGLTEANVIQGQAWRVSKIQEGGEAASVIVYGPPGTLVRWGWPDGYVDGLIEPKGSIGFAMGFGAYYFPPAVGPHYVVIGDGRIDGLGMLGGTNHRHIDVTFRPA